jgi:hypothetical protein
LLVFNELVENLSEKSTFSPLPFGTHCSQNIVANIEARHSRALQQTSQNTAASIAEHRSKSQQNIAANIAENIAINGSQHNITQGRGKREKGPGILSFKGQNPRFFVRLPPDSSPNSLRAGWRGLLHPVFHPPILLLADATPPAKQVKKVIARPQAKPNTKTP